MDSTNSRSADFEFLRIRHIVLFLFGRMRESGSSRRRDVTSRDRGPSGVPSFGSRTHLHPAQRQQAADYRSAPPPPSNPFVTPQTQSVGPYDQPWSPAQPALYPSYPYLAPSPHPHPPPLTNPQTYY